MVDSLPARRPGSRPIHLGWETGIENAAKLEDKNLQGAGALQIRFNPPQQLLVISQWSVPGL
jgi:hypothetical protein